MGIVERAGDVHGWRGKKAAEGKKGVANGERKRRVFDCHDGYVGR